MLRSKEDQGKNVRARPRARRRGRRRWIILGSILAVLALGYVAASALVAPIIRHHLIELADSHLNATLTIGGLRYHFPYGVTVTDAALTSSDAQGRPIEILKVHSVELRLAELPHKNEPLVIEKLILIDPVFQLVKAPEGMVGAKLVKKESFNKPQPALKKKLSQLFRLRQFSLKGGQFIYEDRTLPDTKPMVWSGVHLDLNTAPQSDAVYGYDLKIENLPLSEISAVGTMNIDDLLLRLQEFHLKVEVSPDANESKVAGKLQEVLTATQTRGTLKIDGSATAPLRDMASAIFDATLELPGVSAKMPTNDGALDRLTLKLRCSSSPLTADGQLVHAATPSTNQSTTQPADEPMAPRATAGIKSTPVFLAIQTCEAASGSLVVKLDKGLFILHPDDATWRASDLLGSVRLGGNYESVPGRVQDFLERNRCNGIIEFTAAGSGPLKKSTTQPASPLAYEVIAFPRELSFQPRNFPMPIKNITGSIHVLPGLLSLDNLVGVYGSDKLSLATARVPLDNLKEDIFINEIEGTVDVSGKAQPYPRPLDKIFTSLNPAGLFTITGKCVAHRKKDVGLFYNLGISTDKARIAPTTRRIPIANVRCDLTTSGGAGRGVVDITRLEGGAMGGQISASGHVNTGKRSSYDGQIHISDLDLRIFAEVWARDGEKPMRISGKGYADANLMGEGAHDGRTLLDNLGAHGEFEILDGEFWEIPVLRDLLGGMKVTREALTIGQAAGTFDIHDRQIQFSRAAVSAPVLGLQGDGVVTFDGDLNLQVIAAPLADWREHLKNTGIPIISDVTGEIAGGIQKLLNTATRALLYQFHVTGTIAHPQIDTVPAPILNDAGAALFGKMLSPPKDAHLLDAVRDKKK